ncbi:GTP pyrophosphokinase [[Phormidium ambiguum] IAM M-71]|uniref:GTP pyrophosphokinase n=1 Tax=[Phormidium ambiguum] IAM M-71 TaxID=454136 RepID=A0A1U7IQW8_9CYAN|nr:GTP pyrophosphokinase [Phormidium ambiguum]OKH39756.1 GTP pyrophosphokinase [Phormidium ambiguum IAM M-71]
MIETELLDKAIALAKTAHANQFDKAGAPYIGHPLRVMNSLSTMTEKIVGVLHDSIEDSELTLKDLKNAGFPHEVLEAIEAITKRPNEDYQIYLNRVMGNAVALRVKIADMLDNMDMKRISEPTEKDWKRLKKYQEILPKLQAALSCFESTRTYTNYENKQDL